MQATKIIIGLLIIILMVGCQKDSTTSSQSIRLKPRGYEFKIYRIRQGDTLYSLSKKFDVSIQKILIDNGLRTSKPLEIGQKLYIRSKKMTYQKPIKTTIIKPTSYRPTKSRLSETRSIYKPHLKSPIIRVKGNPPYMLIPRGTGYVKPLSGRVTKRFNNYEGGRPLYGVNIRSAKTQSVRSVHNGVVVFTAENFANFGRCVMIAHSRREKCFYYGLDKITLKVGDVINKGYRIGKINNQKTLGLKILRNEYFVNPQKVVPRL